VVPGATLRAGGRHTSGIRPAKDKHAGFRLTKKRRRFSLLPASVGLAAGWSEILDTRKVCVTCPVGQFWNSDPSAVEWHQLLFVARNLTGYREGVDVRAQSRRWMCRSYAASF
jgi:hypothetical protein